jgi:hypothetical protein
LEHSDHEDKSRGFFASRANLVLLGFLAIAGYFLVTEHWAHVVPFLPWLFLLACPLMHVFMHGGHSEHEVDNDRSGSRDTRPNPRNEQRSDGRVG